MEAARDKGPEPLIRLLLEKHVPEHSKERKPELDEVEDYKNAKLKKTILKVIVMYHPDKASQAPRKDQIFCEEVTKALTYHLNNIK